MARRRARIPLNVFLNSRLVGRLHRQRSGAIEFRYDRSWLDREHTLPISISLPLREDRYLGDPVTAVFDNLLPDPEPVRRRIAERVGAEGPGCVQPADQARPRLRGRVAVSARRARPRSGGTGGRPAPGRRRDRGENPQPGHAPAGARRRSRVPHLDRRSAGENGPSPLEREVARPARDDGDDAHHETANRRAAERRRPQSKRGKRVSVPQADRRTRPAQRDRRDRGLRTASAFWRSTGSTASGQGTTVCCVCRRKIVARRCRCRRPSSTMPTGAPAWPTFSTCSAAATNPAADQRAFIKAQIAFWLLGATDGHAKNFSIFLMPGGRFRMTPLYDVISAQPAVDAGQLRENGFKLALAVGDKRHYAVNTILPRHFTQTAVREGIPARTVDEICGELMEGAEPAIDSVLGSLPPRFPAELAASVIEGMRARLRPIEHALG